MEIEAIIDYSTDLLSHGLKIILFALWRSIAFVCANLFYVFHAGLTFGFDLASQFTSMMVNSFLPFIFDLFSWLIVSIVSFVVDVFLKVMKFHVDLTKTLFSKLLDLMNSLITVCLTLSLLSISYFHYYLLI
jgi:hypothetical protein